jgi:hypothetical protein
MKNTYRIEYTVTGGKRTDYVDGIEANDIVEAMNEFEKLTHSGAKGFYRETRYAITKIEQR